MATYTYICKTVIPSINRDVKGADIRWCATSCQDSDTGKTTSWEQIQILSMMRKV